MEIWKDIEGYPNYMVSNMGMVKSLNYNHTGKEKILKGVKNDYGYLQIKLCKEGKVKNIPIHRLVAQAFIPNPNNLPQVNHINEFKNDNRVENLEFCTPKYNSNFGTRNERIAKAESIPILQFSKTGEFIRKWESGTQIEREIGFNKGLISSCCKGKRKSAYGYKWCYEKDYEKKVA